MTAMRTFKRFVTDVAAEMGFRLGHRRPTLARVGVHRIRPGVLRL